METYSTDTSPRSDSPVIPPPPPPPKVKFMYSYGGRIQPRPLDHRLTYVGGHTKILTVDRSVSYSSLLTKFSSLCEFPEPANLAVKYQLPGEDLDALVSIFDDDDLDHVMFEYDRLCSINPAKTPRFRLFLFPLGSYNKLSSLSTSDSDGNGWFVHALNYVAETKSVNPDNLSGFDKKISGTSDPELNPSPNPQVLSEIYHPKVQEKPTLPEISAAIPVPANFQAMQVPVSGGVYAVANSVAGSNAPVYYFPATGGSYAAGGLQPMTAHGGQDFHGVQKVGAEPVVYNEAAQQLSQPNVAVREAGLGHIGYVAAGRQVFYAVPQGNQAVAVERRQGGGAVSLEGNVTNMAPQSQTSFA